MLMLITDRHTLGEEGKARGGGWPKARKVGTTKYGVPWQAQGPGAARDCVVKIRPGNHPGSLPVNQ